MADQAEFVLDCSTTIAWILEDESSQSANTAFDALAIGRAWVPPLWRTETANAMRSAFRSGRCTEKQAVQKLSNLTIFDIHTSPYDLGKMESNQILQFAHQHDVTAYDAGYLYIAMQMQLPLATLDKNLRRAAKAAKVSLL